MNVLNLFECGGGDGVDALRSNGNWNLQHFFFVCLSLLFWWYVSNLTNVNPFYVFNSASTI